jgi:hypothetical protein
MVKTAAVEATMEPATVESPTVEPTAMETAAMPTATAMRCLRGHGLDQCEDTCQSGRSNTEAARRADLFHLCLLPYVGAESGVYTKRLADTVAGRWPPDEIGFICWPARAERRQSQFMGTYAPIGMLSAENPG